jgi:hypothetical protein
MIEWIFSLAIIMQASSIGLGVGSSTLAITGFLVAIYDGTIDASERRMLGVMYWTLRVAMFGIVSTTAIISYLDPIFFGAFGIYLWILVGVLVANAIAMTKHWISSKYGPAIQAGTWYTVGFMATIHMFKLFEVNFLEFLGLYAVDILFAYIVVNGYMWYRKRKQISQQ